ncbi:MAG: type I 3-dehydroquinate dehydratase [archaeon]|nr:MAG: type I 3-dehydroquinate dehydratase [archaeon]
MLCTSISGQSIDDLSSGAGEALSIGSDLVEFRLDTLRDPRPGSLGQLATFLDRAVLTVRRPGEGGRFPGTESERLTLIRAAIDQKPAYLDIELETLESYPDLLSSLSSTRLIASWHDLGRTPPAGDLTRVLQRARNYRGVPKIVTTATSPADNLSVLSLYKGSGEPPAAFCMGELGIFSRVMAMKYGSPISYVSLPGRSVAPGQLDLKTALELRRRLSNA